MKNCFRVFVYLLTLLATVLNFPVANRRPVSDFPKAEVEAKTLLLTDVPADGSALTLASMQGLLANVSEKNLLFRAGGYDKWLPYTGAALRAAQPDGSPWDLTALLKEFAPFFSGYLLCDDDSAGAAVSLAKQKNSIVVLPAFEETVKAAGLKKTADLRGWSDLKLRFSPEFRLLRRDVAFEQPAGSAPRLLDYAVMCGAYVRYDAEASKTEHTNAFRFLNDNALVFGWNNDLGEHDTVASFASLNACLIPADHAYNLSVLSGFQSAKLQQKTAVPAGSGGRSVCLMMSDGDNLQWFLNSYADASHFGSPVRGRFPFAWGVPASAADTAAPTAARYYDEMTANDAFVLSLSGMGYTFPSGWKNRRALETMAETLRDKMEKLDTRELLVLDDGGFSSPAIDTLLTKTQSNGIFYIDYKDYAGLAGKTRFVDGKPIVSARFKLWAGASGGAPEEIAAAVNAMPADPENPDSYAFIIVHAWSGLNENGDFAPDGDAMAAVERLVQNLDADVLLLSPAGFLARLTEYCG